tara:strand:+ start:709 stop:1140 length:432 start_codon:yes stop_codon:yes gene_type:complete
MGAFDNAWYVLKARTERDQSGSMKPPGRRGKFNQPTTTGAMTNRIPLVGAQNPTMTTDEITPYRATPGANRQREAAFGQQQIREGMRPEQDIMEYTPEDLAAMREHALMQMQNPTLLTDLKNRQISGPGNATMSDVHSMANED